MFRWPGVPSPRACAHEIADFVELLCWKQGSVSGTAVARDMGRIAENDYPEGVPEEEEIPKDVSDAFQEIEERIRASNGGYPFTLKETGTVLSNLALDDAKHQVYRYLLLSTRLNMNDNKVTQA